MSDPLVADRGPFETSKERRWFLLFSAFQFSTLAGVIREGLRPVQVAPVEAVPHALLRDGLGGAVGCLDAQRPAVGRAEHGEEALALFFSTWGVRWRL